MSIFRLSKFRENFLHQIMLRGIIINMKKLNTLLNTIIGAFIGAFIGYGIYVIWDFKTHPELYAMQSAPWYTGILVYGIATLVVVSVSLIIKIIIKKKNK